MDTELLLALHRCGPSPRMIAIELDTSVAAIHARLRDSDCKKAYMAHVSEVEQAINRYKPTPSLLAKLFDVDRHVVMAWFRENPRLGRARENMIESVIDQAEQNLLYALQNGERWATEFTLRTIGAKRGYIEPTVVLDLEAELNRLGLKKHVLLEEIAEQMLLEQDGGSDDRVIDVRSESSTALSGP